jgi:hypothetical protein
MYTKCHSARTVNCNNVQINIFQNKNDYRWMMRNVMKYNANKLPIPTGCQGPSWTWSYGSWIYNNLCNQWLSPLMLWVRISIRARCTTLCDKVCQWLATGRWFSSGPPVSSTNKTGRHDITEILLKEALNIIKQTNKH